MQKAVVLGVGQGKSARITVTSPENINFPDLTQRRFTTTASGASGQGGITSKRTRTRDLRERVGKSLSFFVGLFDLIVGPQAHLAWWVRRNPIVNPFKWITGEGERRGEQVKQPKFAGVDVSVSKSTLIDMSCRKEVRDSRLDEIAKS